MSTDQSGGLARTLRPWVVRLSIGSFSIAALLGIIALLSGGEFGATQVRVLLTTVLVGTVCIHVLCYLPVTGRSFWWVGAIGAVAALAAAVMGLLLIWFGDANDGHSPPEEWWQAFGVALVLATTCAQASLLLALAAGRGRTGLLAGTLACAAVVAAMVIVLILDVDGLPDGYFRGLGVVAILDVLGTVVVAALAKFGGGPGRVALPDDVTQAVASYAARTGREPAEVLRSAVESEIARGTPEG